jgi:catechol 2,3-dioxygenase-like lactoylglutathione lyase family enzyme
MTEPTEQTEQTQPTGDTEPTGDTGLIGQTGLDGQTEFPRYLHTVLDTPDVRGLAEFYRELLGLRYRPGDEPRADCVDPDWLVLVDADGRRVLAFQQVASLTRTTWPSHDVPMQLHVDFTVPSEAALRHHHDRALELGAEVLLDRSHDPDEALYVLADPSGHPFCILVAPQ